MEPNLQFLEGLELDHSSLPENKEQGAVAAGSVVSFTEDLKSQCKEDVLNGTLLAQLAANKKYNRYKDTQNWYKFYIEVLENIGWNIGQFNFRQYNSEQESFQISEVVESLIIQLTGNNSAFVVTVVKTLAALQMSTSGRKIFGSTSVSGQNGNFQIVPCATDKNGDVIAAFLGGFFSADFMTKDYFFVTWRKQKIKLFYSTQMLTLNESVYGRVREKVKEKLGDNAKKFIEDLDI